jgi:hypothetical protein
MIGQARSKTTQARDHNDMVEKWMTQAVKMYRDEQAKGNGETNLKLELNQKAPHRLDKAKADWN